MKWFIVISDKKNSSFIQLDINKLYPSINKDILKNAIQFAKLHTTTDDKDFHLIMPCGKFLLFLGNETWKKKSSESYFDVTMGCFDGAEICELVGLYIQSNLENILPKTNLLNSISESLSKNSSNQKIFNMAKIEYEDELSWVIKSATVA